MFIFYFLGVGLPCRSIFCQFWLCEEAQCVYLRRHLGSLQFFFFFNYIIQRSHFGCMSEGNEITILKIYLNPLQHFVHCSIIHNSKIWAVLKGHQWVSG